MKNDILQMFGKLIIEKVRDEALSSLTDELKGEINSKQSILMRNMLCSFDKSQIETIIKLLPSLIDTSLFYMLEMINSSDELKVLHLDDKSNFVEIRGLSDDLAGELYSEYGWIAKFSKETEGLL